MQKNVPKYTPEWVPTVRAVGGGVEARGVVRAVQRPAHAAVVRQPARGRVPPDAGARRPPRPHDASRARPRPARGRRVRRWRSRAAHLVRAGAGRRRPRGRGQDQRREGRARVRADRRRRRRSRTRPRATRAIAARAERLDPEHRDDRVHEGGPRRQGVRRLDARRRRDGRRRVQPAGPARRAGVVPGRLGRPRRRRARRLHRAHRARAARRRRPVGRAACPRRSTFRADLVEEGHAIPVARVQAMHEGKRRARERG